MSGIDASLRLVRRGQLWTWRDQAIARADAVLRGYACAKVVALIVADVDIGGLQVAGKGNRERRVRRR